MCQCNNPGKSFHKVKIIQVTMNRVHDEIQFDSFTLTREDWQLLLSLMHEYVDEEKQKPGYTMRFKNPATRQARVLELLLTLDI